METNNQAASPENQPQNSNQPVPRSPRVSQKAKIYTGLGIVLLIILGAAAYKFFKFPASPAPQTATKNQTQVKAVLEYKEGNTSLIKVPNFQAIKEKYALHLSAGQEKFLDDNKFLLVDLGQTKFQHGVNFDDMLADFDSIGGGDISSRKPEDTKLITPDVVLHAYHKFFEMTLEELEKKELSQALGDFLTGLHQNLAADAAKNSGILKQRYQNLEAQIVLARVLFENKNSPRPDSFDSPDQETAYNEKDKTIDSIINAKKILVKYSADLPADLTGKVQADLEKIYLANDVGVSPLFGQYSDTLQTDYTQFTPRSHYAKSSALRAYFRTMMYLGRSSYFLQKDVGITDSSLLVQAFGVKSQGGAAPLDPWKKIIAVTGFYAGQSDDLTYTEWQNYLAEVLGAQAGDLTSGDAIQKLAQNLGKLRLPKILSDVVTDPNIGSKNKADLLRNSLSFRIFGQRFSFDAWVLNDLTAGQEQTGVKLPSTPSALFIPAAFGGAQAKNYAKQFLQKTAGFSDADVKGFLSKLDQKQSDIGKVKKDEWFGSMGSAWLYVLGSLTHSFGPGYPKYMQAGAFLDKQIQTFLGSFTELKHDTLLYAKQSYAERGGGGGDEPIPPVVKGFVEPNLDFWSRFSELLNHTEQVFTDNDLFKDHSALARLKNFQDITRFYGDIAQKEMQNQPISDDDYEKLRTTALSFMVQPFEAVDADENSGKVALIADIHTDALKGQILYEATAKPYLMLAIVDNENTPRLTASLVYNHYELTGALGGQRLTDTDWQASVYDQPDKLPAKNFWYQSLLVK